jgi:hypothetical protein
MKKSTARKKAVAYKASPKKAVVKKAAAIREMSWTLPDGVKILAPKTAPKHFTFSEIRSVAGSAAKRG